MNFLILPLFLGILIAWFYAEFKLGRPARLTLGFLSLLGGCFLVYAACQVRPFYESAWHRNAIRDAGLWLQQGQTNLILQAFAEYSRCAATGSTFQASERLMHALKREPAR